MAPKKEATKREEKTVRKWTLVECLFNLGYGGKNKKVSELKVVRGRGKVPREYCFTLAAM